jgi:hypothetical protein
MSRTHSATGFRCAPAWPLAASTPASKYCTFSRARSTVAEPVLRTRMRCDAIERYGVLKKELDVIRADLGRLLGPASR